MILQVQVSGIVTLHLYHFKTNGVRYRKIKCPFEFVSRTAAARAAFL